MKLYLDSSSLNMRNIVAVITGLMDSGKTWLLSRLFNQLPPDLYTSTGITERSYRGLLHHIINLSSSSWEPFNYEQILEFLACLFHENLPDSDVALADKSLPTSPPKALLPPLSFSPLMELTSHPLFNLPQPLFLLLPLHQRAALQCSLWSERSKLLRAQVAQKYCT